MAYGERAVCVTVNGSRKIVNGLDWRTTTQDIIQSLRPRAGPQVLLESWRGCVRPMKEDEYICQILEEWGGESRHVQLVLVNAREYASYRKKPGLKRAEIYRAQSHGKVSNNKRRCLSRLSTPKIKMMAEIERLIETVQANRERLAALQTPLAAESTPESPTSTEALSPSEEEEWVGIQEELAEENQEQQELVQRKAEIKENIESHTAEMEQLKQTNAQLQAKLSLGQEKLERLQDAKESRELEEVQADIQRLQNELRVRMKLNQLQSTKAQELAASISKTEQDTRDCVAEIESLKSAR